MSSRLWIFNVLFAEFSLLQVMKTVRRLLAGNSVDVVDSALVLSLFCSALVVHLTTNPLPALHMYVSFILLSLVDGSMSNHVLTSCTVACLMIASFSRKSWEGRASKSITIFAILLYVGAGIHKLNYGFLDPQHSCANLYIVGALSALPWPIVELFSRWNAFMTLVPIGAILFEFLLPISILVTSYFDWESRVGRRSLVLVGALFHAILALPPSPLSVYPFSAIMLPIYVFLVPAGNLEVLVDRLLTSKWFLPVLAVLYAFSWQYASIFLFDTEEMFEYPNYGMWTCSLVWNMVGWSMVAFSVLRYPNHMNEHKQLPVRPITILILVLFSIVPLGPYLGIRNYPALAMFSNLRTEGNNPNHFFADWDVFQYQQDWVEIIDTNYKPIKDFQINLAPFFPQKLKESAKLFHLDHSEFIIAPPKWNYPSMPFVSFNVPFIELRRAVSQTNWTNTNEYVFIEYIRHFPDGNVVHERFESTQFDKFEDITQTLSFFEKYFVKFRSFYEDYSPCRH